MAKKPNMKPANDGYGTVHTVRLPLWPYMVAPLFCLAALPATYGAHRAFAMSAHSAGWTGVAITLACFGMLAMVFAASIPRGRVMNGMATIITILSELWIVPAILDGPFTKGMIGMWLLGTVVISASCAVYKIMRQARGDDDPRNGNVLNGEFAELGDAVKQLKGAKFRRPVIDGAAVAAAIEMPPGRSFEEVSSARKEVASLLDVRATSVRTVADSDSERRGVVTVVPVDQLRDPIPDPGLEHGLSMADPITLGVAENGSLAQIILPGDPTVHRNAVGVMGVVGMSGSGKTELLLRFAKEVVARSDGELDVADARKAGQLPGWLKRAARQVTDGPEQVLDQMEDLGDLISQRSEWLGSRGFKQWQRGCGLPFRTYIIFEASAILGDSNIVDLAESVRSVGICIVVEVQRATYDRLPTSARSNITTWVCLGVQKEADAEAALSESTIEAGAAPWKWGNGKPGYFYLEWAGRDEETWSAPCRSYIQDDADREADVTRALGWDSAADHEEEEAAAPVPAPRGRLPEEEADDEQEAADPDEPPDDVDPSKPIVVPEGMPRIQFGDGRKMPSGEAVGLLRSYLFDLGNAGVGFFRPQDLGDVLAQTGLSSSWMRNALKELEEEGLVKRTERGVYRLRQPAGVGGTALNGRN